MEALRAITTEDRIAIRSGHGVGKSAWLSWLILWFIITHSPSRIFCTAPSKHQMEDVLWAELARWWAQMEPGLRDYFEWTQDRFYIKAEPKAGEATARTARMDKPEAFQGRHSQHMLFIADEASGIEENIFDGRIAARIS